MNETINDRIEVIINKHFEGNKSAFAKSLGLSPTVMSSYLGKQRRSKPSIDMVTKIITTLKVDALWLLTGEESNKVEVKTEGAYSPATGKGNISMDLTAAPTTPDAHSNDAVLTERVRALEDKIGDLKTIISEKDERIADLKERIDELKTRC